MQRTRRDTSLGAPDATCHSRLSLQNKCDQKEILVNHVLPGARDGAFVNPLFGEPVVCTPGSRGFSSSPFCDFRSSSTQLGKAKTPQTVTLQVKIKRRQSFHKKISAQFPTMFLLTPCAEISKHKKTTKFSLAVLPFAVF